jgi:flagellar biosynthesis protein FlhG
MTLLELTSSSALPATTTQRPFTIAVTSGKGGVGKTNISVNLAALLAARQHSVVLFDADMGLANADLLCGVKPMKNLAHVVAGLARMEDILVPTPAGFSLVPGASGIASLAALSEMQRNEMISQLDALNDQADVMMFDTGAGIGREVIAFARAADHVLLVTTPEPTALMDAYAMIKVLTREQTTATISLIVNNCRGADEARAVHQSIQTVAMRFLKKRIELTGFIENDPAVAQAVRQRVPFALNHPKAAATISIQAIAANVDRLIAKHKAAQRPETPFFRRFMQWWN